MTTWLKDELRRFADTDDLRISPFREDGVTYGPPDVDLVRRVRHPLCARVQRENLSLVRGPDAAEGGADHCRPHDQGSRVRIRRRADQRSRRRCLPGEVSWQSARDHRLHCRAVQPSPWVSGPVDEYRWGGAAGTAFWVDPKDEMISVLMTQGAPGPARGSANTLFRPMVRQAIVE
jgi:CubicO group peptidase (beta-lactamase class C family)